MADGPGWASPGTPPPGAPQGPWGQWRWGPAVPKPGIIPLRPLALGEILDGTFATIRTNPGATVGVTVAAAAVVETVSTTVAISGEDASPGARAAITVAMLGLDLILGLFLSGVLSVVVSEAILGSRITTIDAVRRVAPRLPGLLGLTVIVALSVVLGLIALLVGAIVVGVYLALATPAYVLEGGTVRDALRRSIAIVRGSWWRTFGILLLAMLVAGFLGAIFAIAASIVMASSESVFGDPIRGDLTVTGYIVQAIGSLLATAISTPIVSGAVVLLYVDLRIRREGLDVTLAEAARARTAGLRPSG
ncbi:hypothetical protein ThrDRAFT_00356 [Frankia casuarinae]|nr:MULTISPECIES: hypothetical protein [Frankia]ETA04170.1 hypothetical protein CcI6DRAFT_00385 [Frankia sp. CcI6]EYT93985.1 hypothetical protein ThrDRAFT_00356 [Frankia casuarinae]KDA44610.1 hypothetical protein BMG523Draft_00460 [Frankia sp. BMG5.23]KFB05613.1 hypothetical protein ALLO2DRAFT_01565 [Frankia sp. Allo2]